MDGKPRARASTIPPKSTVSHTGDDTSAGTTGSNTTMGSKQGGQGGDADQHGGDTSTVVCGSEGQLRQGTESNEGQGAGGTGIQSCTIHCVESGHVPNRRRTDAQQRPGTKRAREEEQDSTTRDDADDNKKTKTGRQKALAELESKLEEEMDFYDKEEPVSVVAAKDLLVFAKLLDGAVHAEGFCPHLLSKAQERFGKLLNLLSPGMDLDVDDPKDLQKKPTKRNLREMCVINKIKSVKLEDEIETLEIHRRQEALL